MWEEGASGNPDKGDMNLECLATWGPTVMLSPKEPVDVRRETLPLHPRPVGCYPREPNGGITLWH